MLDISHFGVVDPTGTADSWAAFQNAISAAAGGTINAPIFVPAGLYKVTKQLKVPFNSATPTQRSVRLIGAGRAAAAGSGSPLSYGGTTLQLLFGSLAADVKTFTDGILNGTTTLSTGGTLIDGSDLGKFVVAPGVPSGTVIQSVTGGTVTMSAPANLSAAPVTVTLQSPKILTLGIGTLSLEHMTLYDGSVPPTGAPPGANSVPFLLGTNTTLHLSNIVFWGNGTLRTNQKPSGSNPWDGQTVAGSTTVYSPTGNFTNADKGATIFAADGLNPLFPFLRTGTTIVSVTDSTHVVVSQAATTSSTVGSGARLTIMASFQDAIVLGGAEAGFDATPASQWGGYGSSFSNLYFQAIRRAVLFRSVASDVTFRDAVVWSSCGASGGLSRTFNDGSTGANSPTLTSSMGQGAFTQGDVGSLVVLPGIVPPNTYLTSVTNSTTATMSQKALSLSSAQVVQLLLLNEAAIDVAGVNLPFTQPNSNIIENVLVQSQQYPCAFRVDYGAFNILIANAVQDQFNSGAGRNCYFFTQNSTGNFLIAGYHNDAFPIVDLGGQNTLLNHPGLNAVFAQPVAVSTPASANSQGAGQSITQLSVTPTYQQTSNASATDLLVNRNEVNGVGSGTQNLMDLQVGGTSQFKVDHLGSVTFRQQIWHSSDDGQQRLFFETSGNTYYKTHSNHVFRNVSDVAMMTVGSDGRLYCGAPNTAPSDSSLAASQISFWLDQSGTGNLKVKVKYSDNTTVKTATIGLV